MKEVPYADPRELYIVGLDGSEEEDHPLYDPRIHKELSPSFVKNLAAYGVTVPVAVRRDGGKYVVVDGRQRVRGARELAAQAEAAGEIAFRVPYKEIVGDDARAAGVSVSLNEQRADDSVLDKAFKAVRLMQIQGSVEDVALSFGRTTNTIKNWTLLVGADSAVHEAVREKKISANVGIDIAKLPREEQKAALEQHLRGQENLPAGTKKDKKEKGATSTASGQSGVKRSWLRKALKTEYAKTLEPEQFAVLEWFAHGRSEATDWFDLFMVEANIELGLPTA